MAKNHRHNSIIFSLSFGEEDPILHLADQHNLNTKIPFIKLDVTKTDTLVPDKDRIINEIILEAKKQNKAPILNIHFINNRHIPIMKTEDLKKFRYLNIKVGFTFSNYFNIGKDSSNIWKSLFKEVEYIFFNNDQDRDYAIEHNHVNSKKVISCVKEIEKSAQNLS